MFLIIITLFFLLESFSAAKKILSIYQSRESTQIHDRNGALISLKQNYSGYYAEYIAEPPPHFSNILLEKEDKYFYYHPGVNPISIIRAAKNYILGNNNLASSTITQQLIKILLANEQKRILKNKIVELFYALSLEINLSKKEILKMYCNSIFLGNGTQGIKSASRLYFEKSPSALTDEEAAKLVATISSPTNNNPFSAKCNKDGERRILSEKNLRSDFFNYCHNEAEFEINTLNINNADSRLLAVDQKLTAKLREILKRNLESLFNKNVSNGAIAVIKLPDNELLGIVGSPDPNMDSFGYKINMALQPRPIGSTIKPFIYLKGFEKNLRPYSIVDDKEYKYTIGTGFAFYPKNYDYEYRGSVSLHYALSNSLNVPSVKVLEYAGIENFNNFLLNDLNFKPAQNLENYQLGIALGELEMDLLDLSYYFTIFPNGGMLKPLIITKESSNSVPKKISSPRYIQLINKILSDRLTAVEQFGETSDLNLYATNYAVKTGTSREFHDSWVIGYTPDFLVGVWVGNSDNTTMDAVSGQNGAGRVWHEVMNLLLNSDYNQKTPFDFGFLKEFKTDEGIDYGLEHDNFEKFKNLLNEDSLILNPHNGDTFLLEKSSKIPLKAQEKVEWKINETTLGRGKEYLFTPIEIGDYKIEAVSKNKTESIKIFIEENN